MKKIFLIMAVLMLVSPAWAVVTITATAGTGDDCNEIIVEYSVTGPNNVRAFALDVTVDTGAIGGIVDGSYKVGESNSTSPGYGIFPGGNGIEIVGGQPSQWGTPLADPCDDPDGTQPGPGGLGMTIEMGSLYKEDVNEPDSSGVLFKFWVTEDCTVSIDENTTRGGIVMEDPDEDSGFTGPVTEDVTCVQLECLKDLGGQEYIDWVAWGKPDCWCYKRQCRGDINGTRNLMKWVQALDLTAFRAAFLKTDAALAAVPNGICADLNHTKNLMKRVQALDLTIFRAYFMKMDSLVPCCDANQDCVLDAGDKWNFWTN